MTRFNESLYHQIEEELDIYPSALRRCDRYPDTIYVIGDYSIIENGGLAIVGARRATAYGLETARRFAKEAAHSGVTIVTGGARGIETAALEGALEANGLCIVFLAGGGDDGNIYPSENLPLFERVVEAGGALVFEEPWGAPPVPFMFRARNRLIAGVADATLVIEAGIPSGTFSTVDAALAAGRDVWAVPGNIDSRMSQGSNKLIYQGATPIVDLETFGDQIYARFGKTLQKDIPAS